MLGLVGSLSARETRKVEGCAGRRSRPAQRAEAKRTPEQPGRGRRDKHKGRERDHARACAAGEIVGAGHASASGRLEDHHLFYLMARGIPFDEARKLVIRGFFGQLIATIEVPELRDRITEAVETELTRSRSAGVPSSGALR